MNDQQLHTKVGQDVAQIKNSLNTLEGDNAARFGRLEANLNKAAGKAKEDLVTWVEDGTSQLSEGFEKFTGEAKDSAVSAATAMKKDVGHGFSQYNAKAQKLADKVPGDFGKQAARYPWVAISIALLVGFLLGSLFQPVRQPFEQFQI